MHHGNTLFFRTPMADEPVPFPEVPWATEVSKDYANLSGQLTKPGQENGAGPVASSNPDNPIFQFSADPSQAWMMRFPATHYWEYGQWFDPYTSGELVRDYLMRALYGTFWNVKNLEPEQYANRYSLRPPAPTVRRPVRRATNLAGRGRRRCVPAGADEDGAKESGGAGEGAAPKPPGTASPGRPGPERCRCVRRSVAAPSASRRRRPHVRAPRPGRLDTPGRSAPP
jgi:hypothetical protein